MKNNRKCFCCGTEYNYCPTCEEQRDLETWHIMFDNENCKKIFQICSDDFLKHTTREETISLLENCDLSNLESFNQDIKEQIKDILASKVIEKPSADPVVNMNNNFSYKNKK